MLAREPGDRMYVRLDTGNEEKPDLDLEVPNLMSLSTITMSVEQQDHLKSILYALSEKFKSVQILNSEVARLRQTNEALIQGRIDLQSSLDDTTKRLREEGVMVNKHVTKVQEERNSVAKALELQVAANRDMELEVEKMKKLVANLQRDVTNSKGKEEENR